MPIIYADKEKWRREIFLFKARSMLLGLGWATIALLAFASTSIMPALTTDMWLVMAGPAQNNFSISINGDTLILRGKVRNDANVPLYGRVRFEVDTPWGGTVVLTTNSFSLTVNQVSPFLTCSMGPLTPADIGAYQAMAYAEYSNNNINWFLDTQRIISFSFLIRP